MFTHSDDVEVLEESGALEVDGAMIPLGSDGLDLFTPTSYGHAPSHSVPDYSKTSPVQVSLRATATARPQARSVKVKPRSNKLKYIFYVLFLMFAKISTFYNAV